MELPQAKPSIPRTNSRTISIRLILSPGFVLLLVWTLSLFLVAPTPAAELGSSCGEAAPTRTGKPVEVPLIGAKKFNETLRGLRGKVVVVNMWATWCVPCRQEFPVLEKLYEQHKPEGLELIAISNDDIQNLDDVKEFLKERNASSPTFIVDGRDASALREAIFPQWTGGLPATFFFDRQGDLKSRISGAITPEKFEAAIKPLL